MWSLLWLALATVCEACPLGEECGPCVQRELESQPQPRPSPGRPALRSPEAMDAELAGLSELPLAERVLAVSERFLNTPYLASPLGEGEGFDPDPRIRFDAVDCLTFVEETVALALGGGVGPALSLLDGLRYSGLPRYETRKHLMEAQWLPDNVRKGFLRDVTRRLGGAVVTRVEKILTPQTWTSRSATALRLPAEHQVVGSFPIELVPLKHALDVAHLAPSGTLMMVVREERPLLVTRVTHVGFIVHGRKTMLRHAARVTGKVVDEDLETFFARNAGYAKWPVVGVAFYLVTEPPQSL